MNVLILGGTTEARNLAARLGEMSAFNTTLSLAGRTNAPLPSPVPQRVGGFGGVHGLTRYLKDNAIDVLVDATHPFAEIISNNAALACIEANCARMGLMRPAWEAQAGDSWEIVSDLNAAVSALPDAPAQVFLSVGRQSLMPFAAKPQHHYLIRVIDPPVIPAAMSSTEIVVGRGPFCLADDLELLGSRGVEWLVTKNSGADATVSKLAAARHLNIDVIMIARPPRPDGVWHQSVEEAVTVLMAHQASLAKRSV